MYIARDQFFSRYLDPHKPELAEWGSQIGLWGGDRETALARVSQLAETAATQAGLDALSRRMHCKESLDAIQHLRSAVRTRLFDSLGALAGVKALHSRGWLRKGVESGLNVVAAACLPLVLLALLPVEMFARWRYRRAEDRESGASALRAAAKAYLTVWFERHVDKGELASRILRTKAVVRS
jgi:hypothetical protein